MYKWDVNKGINDMNNKIHSISEIMEPSHLKTIEKNKSLVPVGIIKMGDKVQYNKDMVPLKDFEEVIRYALLLDRYLTQDICDWETIKASMHIRDYSRKYNVK